MSRMRVINIHEPDLEHDPDEPEPYRAPMDRFGPKIGATRMGGSIYELAPGCSICPYHYEWGEEEWLLVLDGPVAVRHVDGEDELRPGDLVCFPPGPEGAHKVTNRGDATVRVLMLSTVVWPAVSVYPDSDKVGVYPAPGERLIVRRGDHRDYFDGEI
jgi:uncharacterized cupin superfamily protein